jgi:heat shock protein HtpX
MATLYTEQSKNVTRTWLLMSVFLVVIIAIGYAFSAYYGNPNILYVFIIFSLVMNFASYWWSDKIALSLNHAKQIKREDNPMLWNTVENLSITAGLPMPRVYIIDDPAPNAFATGRNKEHAAVAATSGLLSIMSQTELEGVIGHELSHVGNRDILLSTVVVVLVGFIAIISDVFRRSVFLGIRRRDNEGEGAGIIMLIGVILSILAPLIATLIQLAISRKREYLADADGALLTRYPEGLASALKKIEQYSRPMKYANTATAHLFFTNPFGGIGKKVSNLFSTHPPIEDRIKALMVK